MTQQHTPKCSERVTQDNWNMRSCSKPVKAVEGGKAYCAVHLPSYVKQKADARYAASMDKWAAQARRYHLHAAAEDLLAALEDMLAAVGDDTEIAEERKEKARAAIAKATSPQAQ